MRKETKWVLGMVIVVIALASTIVGALAIDQDTYCGAWENISFSDCSELWNLLHKNTTLNVTVFNITNNLTTVNNITFRETVEEVINISLPSEDYVEKRDFDFLELELEKRLEDTLIERFRDRGIAEIVYVNGTGVDANDLDLKNHPVIIELREEIRTKTVTPMTNQSTNNSIPPWVFLVAIVGIGGFWWYNKQKKEKEFERMRYRNENTRAPIQSDRSGQTENPQNR